MNRYALISTILLLASCGRDVTDAEVKFVGVGLDPEQIEAEPELYGGTVELNHIDFAGAGLPVGIVGLVSYDEIGPEMMGWSPPYEAVSGFSYVFDRQLRINNMSSIAPNGPSVEDACLTIIEPSGPIGSFTTVDVGDEMTFYTPEGEGITLPRMPKDYPPDPQGLFIYYFGVNAYLPQTKYHLMPDPAAPNDAAAMVETLYQRANYPFGQEVTMAFPGGFSNFIEPVASIPLPSTHLETDNAITLPQELDGVLLEWQGPRFDNLGNVVDEGAQRRCFEFYGDGRSSIEDLTDCDELGPLPRDERTFDSFPGQMYTAPWDTDDGRLTLKWTPKPGSDDTVSFTLRFLSEIEYDNDYLVRPVVEYGSGKERKATACEESEADVRFDWTQYAATDENEKPIQTGVDENGDPIYKPIAGLQGDPSSRMAEVVCTLSDDGEHTLDMTAFQSAYDYVNDRERNAGGVVFIFSRSQQAEATLPPAKDQYDLRHEMNPVSIQAAAARIGRFWWSNENTSDGE